MHVCLTSTELFPDKVGGFGRATRAIGRGLVERGVTVTVVIPRRSAERPDEYELDGMRVLQFDGRRPWRAVALYRSCDADVYHSQDTSLGTRLAMRARPDRPHVITFRDPMDADDWRIETQYAGHGRVGWTLYREFVDGRLVTTAVRRADARYCAAEFLRSKVRDKYGLDTVPGFLPTPVNVPDEVEKSARPTVAFIGRWEGRKRPERFFELARACPDVRFVAVGAAQDEARDRALREIAARVPNLELTGAIDQFSSDGVFRLLEESWVVVNTSAREGLPNVFLEACAYRCALLSHSDPDGFASRYGVRAEDDLGSLKTGLEHLLEEDRWRALGQSGYDHVRQVFATDRALQAHLDVYDRLA